MRAELTDGRIVELVQDCDCITHTGPHWLHADALTKAQNAAFATDIHAGMAQLQSHADAILLIASMRGHAEMEMARLEEKRREMQRRGIVRLIEDAPEPGQTPVPAPGAVSGGETR